MKLGGMQRFEQRGNRVFFYFDRGRAEVDVLSPGILRFLVPRREGETYYKAVREPRPAQADIRLAQQDGAVFLRTEKLCVRISDEFQTDIFDADGLPLCLDYRGERAPFARPGEGLAPVAAMEGHNQSAADKKMKILSVKRMPEGARFYGLGEKTGPLNKRGYFYRMWNTDDPGPHTEDRDPLYKSVPFFLVQCGKTAYGIFLDNSFESFFDMGHENGSYYYFGAMGGELDYYFILGPSLKEVVTGYTGLTGRPPLPPLWALGYQQSRFSYAPKEYLMEIAGQFRRRRIPCDALYLDIHYMDGYRVFTHDPAGFSGFPEMLAQLRRQGYHVVAIIDPGVKRETGYAVYDEGLKNGFFLRGRDGLPYMCAVWPGEAVLPDFSDPAVRAWWGEKQSVLLDDGIAGIWNDMNEPASFKGPLPDDLLYQDGGHPAGNAQMHNVYGHMMAQASFEGQKRHGEKRPFVLTRACFAGTQRYSAVWTGDNRSLWEQLWLCLPQLMNLGLSGFSFAGCDIGGFGADCTPELLARWMEAGSFFPFFRNHSGCATHSQEPWAFDRQTESICRKYIELRYSLLPYLYDTMRRGEQTGLPLMRPLVLEFQDDPAVGEINDQFLCGESLLIAPVVQQGQRARAVYLPRGADWVDFWTKERFPGGQYVVRETPPDVCPVYIRQGAVVPRWPVQQFVGEKPPRQLTLEVYLPRDGKTSSYLHVTDDGETCDYRSGGCSRYEISAARRGTKASIRIVKTQEGYPHRYDSVRLRLPGAEVSGVTINGQRLSAPGDGSIQIPGETAEVTADIGTAG